ncbi:bile acid:sodium symporter family protein [Streptomyces sp. NPDC057217]|uniref:bile acid:sodium symporter family protein n=1 Tax=Streptomyces sp. NPDC057217 TaxID=3346054 RepID=UPI00363D119B
MDTPLATVFLPLALAVIMFGLGLSLTSDDFRRVRRHPRAVVVAMCCQLLLLPVLCLGLVVGFGLSPVLAVGKVLQVFALVLVPVAIGLVVRRRSEAFARRMDRPVRLLSVIVLVAVIIGALVAEQDDVVNHLVEAGPAALAFCVASLTIGYFAPRLLKLDRRQSIACSMEIGVHNSAVAMTPAISVLGSVGLAVPAAVYGVLMYPVAALAGMLTTRGSRTTGEPAPVN